MRKLLEVRPNVFLVLDGGKKCEQVNPEVADIIYPLKEGLPTRSVNECGEFVPIGQGYNRKALASPNNRNGSKINSNRNGCR